MASGIRTQRSALAQAPSTIKFYFPEVLLVYFYGCDEVYMKKEMLPHCIDLVRAMHQAENVKKNRHCWRIDDDTSMPIDLEKWDPAAMAGRTFNVYTDTRFYRGVPLKNIFQSPTAMVDQQQGGPAQMPAIRVPDVTILAPPCISVRLRYYHLTADGRWATNNKLNRILLPETTDLLRFLTYVTPFGSFPTSLHAHLVNGNMVQLKDWVTTKLLDNMTLTVFMVGPHAIPKVNVTGPTPPPSATTGPQPREVEVKDTVEEALARHSVEPNEQEKNE